MKIGISTASLYPMETEKALTFLGQNEIRFSEIFFNSPSELEPDFVRLLDKIRREYGIKITSVHPCGSVGEPYFLFSSYERRFKDSAEYYKKYYEAAAILGAETVVLHGDCVGSRLNIEEYCRRLLIMNQDAKQQGVSISHENVNKFRAYSPEEIIRIKEGTNSEIGFVFDIKQAVRSGQNVYDVYNAMKGNIVCVHISDNQNGNDCMLPGKGDFDFGQLFERLSADGFQGSYLIEVYRDAYESPRELIESYDFVINNHKNR